MDGTVDIDRLIWEAKLPSPSPVVLALYDALENGGAEEIAHIIESEPALAARLLRLANSAFYGASPVATVREAVVKVGTTEVAALVLSTEIMRIFYGIPERRFNMQSFWEHSLQTACFSRVLSRFSPVAQLAPLWMCGLLHDIGKLLLVRRLPIEYGDVLKDIEDGVPALEAEMENLGTTHTEVGGRLLKSWKLPELFAACASRHHETFTDLVTPESIVGAANALTNQERKATDVPGVTETGAEHLLQEVGQLYESYRQLFAEYLR